MEKVKTEEAGGDNLWVIRTHFAFSLLHIPLYISIFARFTN